MDTIVALATPPGRSALAVVRLSGDRSWVERDLRQRRRGRRKERAVAAILIVLVLGAVAFAYLRSRGHV